MKAILISTPPKACKAIASGKKTIEVRKTRPKIETPFKCYIYIKRFAALAESCLTVKEMREYAGDKPIIYAWHISDLKIYDKPKELSELKKPCNYKHPCCLCKYFNYDAIYEGDDNAICKIEHITRPPQSWCYVEELVGE